MSFQAVATRHAAMAKRLIYDSANTVEIELPPARPAGTGASLFGDLVEPKDEPTISDPVPCLWYDARAIPTASSLQALQLLGRYPSATAIAHVWLEDVLTDPEDVYSETLFHVGSRVVYHGRNYSTVAQERHGMANIPPYLLIVVLKGEVHSHAQRG
jgi:hypothetical protein